MIIIKENLVTESSIDVIKGFSNLVSYTTEELDVYNRNFQDRLLATAYVTACIANVPDNLLKAIFGVNNKLKPLIDRYLPGILRDFSPF